MQGGGEIGIKDLVPAGHKVDVLTGGFACVTLSSSGKHLAQKDPRSRQLWDTMEMAIFFEGRAVLLEILVQLVDADGDYHLLPQEDEVALEFGYTRAHVWRRKHSSCGGGSQRLHVLLLWLHSSVVLKLAPILDWQPEQEASPVQGFLVPVGNVPSWCNTPGVLMRGSQRQGQDPGDARRGGVHRYGGKGVPVVVGSRVKLPGDGRVWELGGTDVQVRL